MTFGFSLPGRVIFGRGAAADAPALIRPFGARGIVVHGADPRRAAGLVDDLAASGAQVTPLACAGEPTLPMLLSALALARSAAPDWIVALGGGAVIDMGKALAALVPARGEVLDHLEGVGKGLPLRADPLPFVALPTTAGTGAEATRNAVIGLPEHGRKVSLRDDRMLPRIALVDPALTDGCPRGVTLASGLDAVTQVIEPYISVRATPFTDALARPAIGQGLGALRRLMTGEDPGARDTMAWVSLTGGIALANAGLGAVHGLAGVIGGRFAAPHGAVCGTLLGPVLAMNRARVGDAARITEVCNIIAGVMDCDAVDAPAALSCWAHANGLPRLADFGVGAGDHEAIAQAARTSSSMKGNPVGLDVADLVAVLAAA